VVKRLHDDDMLDVRKGNALLRGASESLVSQRNSSPTLVKDHFVSLENKAGKSEQEHAKDAGRDLAGIHIWRDGVPDCQHGKTNGKAPEDIS